MLRIYRAESNVGLQEYKTAIEDLNFVISKMPNWPEVSWYELIIFQYCVCRINKFQIIFASIKKLKSATFFLSLKICKMLKIIFRMGNSYETGS